MPARPHQAGSASRTVERVADNEDLTAGVVTSGVELRRGCVDAIRTTQSGRIKPDSSLLTSAKMPAYDQS